MAIRVISHGSKQRPCADQHVDCRSLPNPHDIPGFRPRDGRTRVVAEWVLGWPQSQALIDQTLANINDNTTVAVMCATQAATDQSQSPKNLHADYAPKATPRPSTTSTSSHSKR